MWTTNGTSHKDMVSAFRIHRLHRSPFFSIVQKYLDSLMEIEIWHTLIANSVSDSDRLSRLLVFHAISVVILCLIARTESLRPRWPDPISVSIVHYICNMHKHAILCICLPCVLIVCFIALPCWKNTKLDFTWLLCHEFMITKFALTIILWSGMSEWSIKTW